MNNCILIGRVTRDIDLKYIPSTCMAVAKFALAVDKGLYGQKKKEAEQQGKPTADFINISVFGKTAENCANYLAKGSQCAVQGRITTGSYITKTGEKRYTTEVIADRVEFLGSRSNMPEEDIFEPVGDDDIPF